MRGDKKTRDSTPALRAEREAAIAFRVHEFELPDDASARGFETVFVSAGRWGLELELAADDLVRVCGAEVLQLAR